MYVIVLAACLFPPIVYTVCWNILSAGNVDGELGLVPFTQGLSLPGFIGVAGPRGQACKFQGQIWRRKAAGSILASQLGFPAFKDQQLGTSRLEVAGPFRSLPNESTSK